MNADYDRDNGPINRRRFLRRLAQGTALGLSGPLAARRTLADTKAAASTPRTQTITRYLEQVVLNRKDVDRFLDPNQSNWATFDPELGYTLRNCVRKDGLDGAYTIGRYGSKHGERKVINFADRPCRLNTYGDSFTMCHQVSDGETWQECLAAHLGEPIGNFGVGGYGVYQAYRRMLRTEATEIGTPHVILNIWGLDDHHRSIDAWRYLRCHGWLSMSDMFHTNPWDHLGIDLDTGRVVERKAICPTPESLYKLCDREFVVETFKDDPALNLHLASQGGWEVNTGLLQRLAEALGLKLVFNSPDGLRGPARTLYWECARRGSLWVLDKARAFCARKSKRLLVLLSYSTREVIHACKGLPRRDQDFLDALKNTGIRYVDGLEKHARDFRAFRLTPEEYAKRYYIGHYNPRGNHFFAFAIKDDVVAWLDPKPPAYWPHGTPSHFATPR